MALAYSWRLRHSRGVTRGNVLRVTCQRGKSEHTGVWVVAGDTSAAVRSVAPPHARVVGHGSGGGIVAILRLLRRFGHLRLESPCHVVNEPGRHLAHEACAPGSCAPSCQEWVLRPKQ
jgi:hypothetical protein